MKTCPKCGKEFRDECDYCTNCGTRLSVPRVKPVGPKTFRLRTRAVRGMVRLAWESFLVLFGLGMLIFSFLVAHGQMGTTPTAESVWSVGILLALGVSVAFIGLRGTVRRVRILGGTTFGAAGLGLILFSFLETHGLMGQTPRPANLVWLLIMMAVGGFLTVRGIPIMQELETGDRKTWGSAFVAASLAILLLSIFTVDGQIGEAPGPGNVVWPFVMMSLGAFLFVKGFPLVREPKDNIRTFWESASLAVGILAALLLARAAIDLNSGARGSLADAWMWMVMLFVVCVVLLAKGIGLIRDEHRPLWERMPREAPAPRPHAQLLLPGATFEPPRHGVAENRIPNPQSKKDPHTAPPSRA